MTTDERHRPSHHLRRRIRVRRRKTGEPYAVAARAVEAEQALGLRHLSDPAVPAELAAAVRAAGFIPLEPFDREARGDWWCRCPRCDQVVTVLPGGHGYRLPGRSPYYLHDPRHCATPGGVAAGRSRLDRCLAGPAPLA